MGVFEAVKNVIFGKSWGFFSLCAPVSLYNLSSFTQARIVHFYCCCMLNKEKPYCPTLLHYICCFFTEGNWGSVVAFTCLSANAVPAVLFLPKPALVILCSSAFFPSDCSLVGSRIHLLAELALGAHLLAANRWLGVSRVQLTEPWSVKE